MATRFYLPSTSTSPIQPATPTGWNFGTPSPPQRPLVTTPSGTAQTDQAVAETLSTVHNLALSQYISDPLNAGAISGTFSAVIRGSESVTTADMALQVGVYVISNDGSVIRGTLYAGHTAALGTTAGALGQEWNGTTAGTRIIPSGTALTSVTAQAGDRILIIIGHRVYNTSATSRSGTLRTGDAAASDFALTAALTTDLRPWVELSQTLSFQPAQSSVNLTAAAFALTGVPLGMPFGATPNFQSTAASQSTSDISWRAGDYIAVLAITADQASTVNTPSAIGGMTFAPQGSPVTTLSSCWGHRWVAGPMPADGTGPVSATRGGGGTNQWGMAAWVCQGNGPGATAAGASTAKTQSLPLTGVGSRVLEIIGDWSAGAITGRVWTPAGAFERVASDGGGVSYSAYAAGWFGQSGTNSYGLTGTASTGTHTKVVLEMKGSSTAVSVTLTAASFAFSGAGITATPGPVSVNLTPASSALVGGGLSATPQPVSVALSPAAFAFSGVTLVGAPRGLVALSPASFAFSGVTLTQTLGSIVTLSPASFALSGVTVVGAPRGLVALSPGSIAFVGATLNPVGSAGAGSVTLAPAGTALVAVPVTPVPGAVSVSLSPASAALTAPALGPVPQPVSVALSPASIAFTAQLSIPPAQSAVVITPAILELRPQSVPALGAGLLQARGWGIVSGGNAAVSTVPFTYPVDATAPHAGDVGLMVVISSTNQPVGAAVPGWTLLDGPRNINNVTHAYLFRRAMDGSEPGTSFTVTMNATARTIVAAVWAPGSLETGVDSYIEASSTDTTLNIPAFTPQGSGDLAIAIGGLRYLTATPAGLDFSGSGWTELADSPFAANVTSAFAMGAVLAARSLTGSAGVAQSASTATITGTIGRESVWVVRIAPPVQMLLSPASFALIGIELGADLVPVETDLAPASVALSAPALAPVSSGVAVLSPASMALSGPALAPVAGVVSVALTPASVALGAVATPPSPVAVQVALSPGSITLSALALGPGAVGSANLTRATLALVGVTLAPVPGSVSVQLTPATLATSARALTPAPQAVQRTLTPAVLVFVPSPTLTPSGTGAVAITPAVVALSGRALAVVPGPVTVALSAGSVALSPRALGIAAGGFVGLAPASVALSARALTPSPRPVSVALDPAAIVFEPLALGAGSRGLVNLTRATLVLAAQPVVPVKIAVRVNLTQAVLVFTARPGSPGVIGRATLVAGSFALLARPLGIVPVAPVVTLAPGRVTLTARTLGAVPRPVALGLSPAGLALVARALVLAVGRGQPYSTTLALGGLVVELEIGRTRTRSEVVT